MKQFTLHLADGQSISINSAQIIDMRPIIHEDYDAKTHIYLKDGRDFPVVESMIEVEELINIK